MFCWARHGKRWRKPFRYLGVLDAEFGRGFVEAISIPADVFLINQDRLFALAPIQRLELLGVRLDQVQAIASLPHRSRLHTLNLAFAEIDDDGMAILAQTPQLAGLKELCVGSAKIGPDGMFRLANSPYLSNLETLILSGNPIGPQGARELANSPYLKGLKPAWRSMKRKSVMKE